MRIITAAYCTVSPLSCGSCWQSQIELSHLFTASSLILALYFGRLKIVYYLSLFSFYHTDLLSVIGDLDYSFFFLNYTWIIVKDLKYMYYIVQVCEYLECRTKLARTKGAEGSLCPVSYGWWGSGPILKKLLT